MKKSLNILLFWLGSFSGLLAQDFHLSIYDAAPMFLNPALTGVVDAPWRIHAQYRNQWRSVAFKPYNTALLSFDMPKGKWGFGGQVMNMRAGIGNYNVASGLFSFSYNVPLDKGRHHELAMGMQGGVIQKSVEYNLLTYDNQYVGSGGGYFDKNISSGESFASQSQILPQVNAGVLYYYAKEQSRLNPFIGVSAFNITQPKETFFDMNNRLPLRVYVHAGTRVNITETFYLVPKVLAMKQTTAFEHTYGLDMGYFMKHDEIYLLAGGMLRAKDAGMVYIGMRKDFLVGKIGYDINVSSLKDASQYRGAFEISITYMGKKDKIKEIRNCPRL
jgi:type IX secretion system PorP/SprF family membrane protein